MPVRKVKKRWFALSPSGAPLSSHKTRMEAEIACELAEAQRHQREGLTLTRREQEMVDAPKRRM